MAYATLQDLYDLGLKAQAFRSVPRPFEAVNVATGTIRLSAHGLSADDLIELVAVSGGSLPGGVAALTQYNAVIVGSDLFQLQGVASFSSSGSGWAVSVDPARFLQRHIDAAAARINQNLTAHEPPIQPDPFTGEYPDVLVQINARMAAREAVVALQFDNAAFRTATDRLFALEAFDKEQLAAWKAGQPIQPRPADQDELADNAARAGSFRDPVGWMTGKL